MGTLQVLTQELLNGLLEYQNGVLVYKRNGLPAGRFDGRRTRIKIKGKQYSASRLIFFMFNGFFPEIVDHIDGDHLNNKIENLRSATSLQNAHNRKIPCNNTTGTKNVKFHKRAQKWVVSLSSNKNRMYFGLFEDRELAELVALEARDKYHGEFARHA